MKDFAKILALILALALVSSCLFGCTKKEAKKIADSAAEIVNNIGNTAKSDGGEPFAEPNEPVIPDPNDPVLPEIDNEYEIESAIDCYFYYTTCLDFETAVLWVDPNSQLYASMEEAADTIDYEAAGLTEDEFNDITFELADNSDYEITNLEFDDDSAVAEIEFYCPDTTQFDITTNSAEDIANLDAPKQNGTITLEKIDGEWLITKFE